MSGILLNSWLSNFLSSPGSGLASHKLLWPQGNSVDRAKFLVAPLDSAGMNGSGRQAMQVPLSTVNDAESLGKIMVEQSDQLRNSSTTRV